MRIFVSSLLPLFLFPFLNAQDGSPAASATKTATVEGVVEYQLGNGARVLLYPEPSRPTITVNMTVLVGSRHEGYGEAGMAHLLEHLVFKGTPTFPEIPKALRDHGANFNGTTNQDRTNYFETLPASDENLEFAIHLECDRLVNSFIRREDLLSEFTVVRNEFERGENSPESVLGDRVMGAAFDWHNYGKTTIGNRSDIERVPIDRLQDFYRKYYQPDNVVLIVTGRFDEAKALALAVKYLGSIAKPARSLGRTYTEEPAQDGERLVILQRVGKVGSIMAAYHMPAASHPDWAPLSILGSVLSEDKVGLLERVLVESGIATSARGSSDNSFDPGLFTFTVQPAEGKLAEAREKLVATLDGLAGESLDAAAVDRAKLRSARRTERLLADAGGVAMALSSASAVGDWRLLFLQRDRIAQVTVDDVVRVAQTYFPPHNRTLGVFIPTDEPRRLRVPQVESIADVVKDYQGGKQVALGESFDPTPENLDARTKFSNIGGIKVGMLAKSNSGQTVSLTMALHYGNEQSLAGKTSPAGMLSGMLMAGTKTKNRQALQEAMNQLGVTISSGGGRGRRGGGGGGGLGTLAFSIDAKRDSLVGAIQLLGEILREPGFPQDEFDQSLARTISGLSRMQSEPDAVASIELSRALSQYPQGDPRYSPTMEERIQMTKSTTLEQIKEIYANQVSAMTGEISVVGDFDPASTMDALVNILKEWTTAGEFREITREAKPDTVGSKSNLLTPDKANATFIAGLSFAMDDEHPDSVALEIGNFILGGGSLSSRLGDRIRQQEGLSYGVGSSLSIPALGNDARFTISAITNPQNIDAVENAASEELTRFIDEGPTAKELSDAVKAWLEQRKVARSRDESVADQINSNSHLNRTFGFTIERERRVAALTVDDIRVAFRKHIDPRKLTIIRAGDFKK
jgi:zinc protease